MQEEKQPVRMLTVLHLEKALRSAPPDVILTSNRGSSCKRWGWDPCFRFKYPYCKAWDKYLQLWFKRLWSSPLFPFFQKDKDTYCSLYTQNNQLQLNKYKQRQNAHMDCIPLATHVFEPGVYFMGDYEHWAIVNKNYSHRACLSLGVHCPWICFVSRHIVGCLV